MALTKELIQEFAKTVVGDETEVITETTCYGTAKFQGNVGYVQLDGADMVTPATFTVSAHEGDRVLVLLKGRKALVIGNITTPVLTVGILKASVGIIVQGYLTTNEDRVSYDDKTHYGLTFSDGGIGAYGGGSKYWYVKNDGTLYASSAEIVGAITATSLTLAENVTVPYSKISDVPDLEIFIKKDGTLGKVSEGTTGLTISSAGLLQASNAIIWGTIYASAGVMGGFTLENNSIHTTGAQLAGNGDNNVALSSDTFTRTVAGASRTNLKFAIGSRFGVANNGALYASGATIEGAITATSLTLGSGASIAGYVTEKSLSDSLTVYIQKDGKIAKTGSGTSFTVSSAGLLTAENAIISGQITASSGAVGGFTIKDGKLYTNNHTAMDTAVAGVFLSADGIALGSGAKFKVTSAGVLTATGVDVSGTIAASAGSVGGFTIQNGALYTNNHSAIGTATEGVFLSADGIGLGSGGKFNVTKAGVLSATGVDISGKISATEGAVGGFTIKDGKLYTNNHTGLDTNVDGVLLSADGISLGSGGKFKVTKDGVLTAQGVKIQGDFTANSLTLGSGATIAGYATTASLSVYVKQDGTLGTVADGNTGFVVSKNGLLQASNAVIYGTLYASSGKMGGFALESNSIHTVNVAVTSNADSSVALSSSTFTRTIGEKSRANLKFAIGKYFGVQNDGTLYSGKIYASDQIYVISSSTSSSITNKQCLIGYAMGSGVYGNIGYSWGSTGWADDDSVDPSALYPVLYFTSSDSNIRLGGNTDVSGLIRARTVYSYGEIQGLVISGTTIRGNLLSIAQGMRIATYSGTSGSAGYIRICILDINKTYIDSPIEIKYICRSRQTVESVFILFKGVNGYDPALDTFRYFSPGSSAGTNAFIAKTATGQWSVYVRKASNYGIIEPVCVCKGNASPDVIWSGTQVSSLPSGYTTATNSYTEMYDKLYSDLKTYVDSKTTPSSS